MRKKKESLVLGRMLRKIAPQIGASVLIEPEYGIVGQITFKSGNKSYFRYNTLDLNPVGSSDVSKDKDYANFFMKKMGYVTVPGSKAFYSESWAKAVGQPKRTIDAAYAHALKLGFPVVVKPNSGSQGVNVALVHTKKDFYQAMRRIFRSDRIALVQQKVSGKDYRIVVLDDQIVSAYERIPLHIEGNGRSTILSLLKTKQKRFREELRDTQIAFDDTRIINKLKRQGLTLESIPKKGEHLFLLDNANLSAGGSSIDVTHAIHPEFAALAINLTRDMGLRLCGVDLMIEGSIEEKPERYHILEINAAPGLDHYVTIGSAQEKIVEDLYLQVLKHLEH
jgi:D-alanine-D-alanine ligase-like ATP-grasp enzyme